MSYQYHVYMYIVNGAPAVVMSTSVVTLFTLDNFELHFPSGYCTLTAVWIYGIYSTRVVSGYYVIWQLMILPSRIAYIWAPYGVLHRTYMYVTVWCSVSSTYCGQEVEYQTLDVTASLNIRLRNSSKGRHLSQPNTRVLSSHVTLLYSQIIR